MVRLYGVLVTLGIVAGAAVAERLRQKLINRLTDQPINLSVWDALVWIVIPGVIGARLYHVVDLWEYYRVNLWLIPQVWTGGLGIFGALFGGIVGLYLFVRQSVVKDGWLGSLKALSKTESTEVKRRFLFMLDLVGVGAPLGQAIGRWGNFFNQELYGKPFDFTSTSLSTGAQGKPPFYAIYISPENRLSGYEQYTHFHPLFLYESMWNLAVFGVLFWLSTRKNKQLPLGTIFTLYIMFYSLGRFFLERFRIEPWTVTVLGGVIPTAQLVSGGLMFGAGLILLRLRWRQVV